MSDLIKSGDKQQYAAVPHKSDPDAGVLPEVKLVWMTPDPLGAMAFFQGVYSGRFYESLDEVTDEERYQALADVQKTHLQAPLEVIKVHLRFDGVDRAFTHQLVRQRTAVYAQESMRFSVLGELEDAVVLPPSLAGTKRSLHEMSNEKAVHNSFEDILNSTEYLYADEAQRKRMVHDYVVRVIDAGYHHLVHGGMPAEEARGLLPTEVATRINYVSDLRNMKDHAGNRLCTQAQFHWRMVWNGIVGALRNYSDGTPSHDWQYKAIADSALFRPVCYQIGHCPFTASFDRACSIRERVEYNAKRGRPSDTWHENHYEPTNMRDPLPWSTKEGLEPGDRPLDMIPAINPAEWLLDPGAARL